MAITNKLITFNKLTSFETQLAQGNILETSIVFIKDAKKIWTKGTYFDCSGGGSSNIAIYETTDDVYNGVLNDTTYELSYSILRNKNIHTVIIIQKMEVNTTTNVRTFVFNACDRREPGITTTFTCLYSEADVMGNTTNLIFYQIAKIEGAGIKLNKQPIALKSDIGYITEFSVADIEAVYGRGITKPINVQGLMSAIEANKPIIIPTNITDASNVGGNAVTMAKMDNDGFIYLNVIVPYLDGVHKEYFIQIKITTAQLIKSGSNGSITLKELVAKTDLKTINGESILGSGNITISGGGSSSGSAAYPEVNHGTSDTIFTLTPNTFHIWDEVETLQLVYARPTAGIANEYLFQFTSGATATTLYLPDSIKWAGGSAPTIQPYMIYQISILNDLGSVLEFISINTITFNIDSTVYTAEKGMTWGEWINSDFNTDGYYISANIVRKDSMYCVIIPGNYNGIYSSDIIQSDYSYTLFFDD